MGKNCVRWRVKRVGMWVSVCLDCCQFVCAEPDAAKVDKTEATHRCQPLQEPPFVSRAAVPERGAQRQVPAKALTEADGAVAS